VDLVLKALRAPKVLKELMVLKALRAPKALKA
jgi:hypothetical protein